MNIYIYIHIHTHVAGVTTGLAVFKTFFHWRGLEETNQRLFNCVIDVGVFCGDSFTLYVK